MALAACGWPLAVEYGPQDTCRQFLLFSHCLFPTSSLFAVTPPQGIFKDALREVGLSPRIASENRKN